MVNIELVNWNWKVSKNDIFSHYITTELTGLGHRNRALFGAQLAINPESIASCTNVSFNKIDTLAKHTYHLQVKITDSGTPTLIHKVFNDAYATWNSYVSSSISLEEITGLKIEIDGTNIIISSN